MVANIDGQPPSLGEPRRTCSLVARSGGAGAVLATIFGVAGACAVWVNRQALNTRLELDEQPNPEDEKVQTALSAYPVHELLGNVNVSADPQKVAPKQLEPWAGPAHRRVAAARK
jgi:hypothetical protein